MKKINISIILIMIGLFACAQSLIAQTQPYQTEETAATIDTAGVDTVAVPYVKGAKTTGIITNHSDSYGLKVWFSKRDSSARDLNTYVLIPAGQKIRFSFYGRKIYRKAESHTVFSQVVYGDDIDISGGAMKFFWVNIDTTNYWSKDELDTADYWNKTTLDTSKIPFLATPNVFTESNTFNSSVTLPAFTDYGTWSMGDSAFVSLTADSYSGVITLLGTVIPSDDYFNFVIISDKIGAGAIVVWSFYPDVNKVVQGASYINGNNANLKLINTDGSSDVNELTIRWKIVN